MIRQNIADNITDKPLANKPIGKGIDKMTDMEKKVMVWLCAKIVTEIEA